MTYFQFDENTPLSFVTNDMFKNWTIDMLERDIKPTSINRYLRDCKVFFNWCINNALLSIPSFEIDMVKGQEEPLKSFPDEDLIAILEKPKNAFELYDYLEFNLNNIIWSLLVKHN